MSLNVVAVETVAEFKRNKSTSKAEFEDLCIIRILFFQKYARILTYSIFSYVNKNKIRRLKFCDLSA